MEFHPNKCNVLTISRKQNPLRHQYTLHGHILEAVTRAKYLGCLLTSDMRWNDHISSICGKANKTLGFLRRNLNISSIKVKENAYKSLVRPLVEYASSVWDPYQQKDIYRLEMIQRRAARYVSNRFGNRSSVDHMLNHLNWRSLEQRRKDARLTLLYKIVNDKVCIEKSGRLITPSRRTRHTQQHSFQITSCSSDYRKFSFFPRTIREWNSLPPDIVTLETSDAFKAQVSLLH
ncbi:hypothetical protein SNE40_020289 [Patella caerulea]|uniref:Uncharacterized protein n=1 Tax=Patella caerulea TaxID=87958 RepID=A0AAN8GDW3_PATCE